VHISQRADKQPGNIWVPWEQKGRIRPRVTWIYNDDWANCIAPTYRARWG
jgi:hypothetical protein